MEGLDLPVRERATISDIAEHTGLSRSTIYRVLDGRQRTRPDTKKRVGAALVEFGFARSALDALSRDQDKAVSVILPKGSNPFFRELSEGFARAIALYSDHHLFRCHLFDPYNPNDFIEILKSATPDADSVIAVGVDSPSAVDAIDLLESSGTRVITVVADVPMSRRSAFVGQDSFLAGRVAGRLMSQITLGQPGELLVMTGHLEFRHLLDRRAGFEQFINLSGAPQTIHFAEPYGCCSQNACRILEETLELLRNPVGVYISGGGQPGLYELLETIDIKAITHEVSEVTRPALAKGALDVVIGHDIGDLCYKALKTAIEVPRQGSVVRCGIDVFVLENLPPAIGQV